MIEVRGGVTARSSAGGAFIHLEAESISVTAHTHTHGTPTVLFRDGFHVRLVQFISTAAMLEYIAVNTHLAVIWKSDNADGGDA